MGLSARDALAVWHPYTQSKIEGEVPAITRAQGALLWDENGKEYIDAISSWWVNLHGHSHPHITMRLNKQLEQLHHIIFAGFTHSPAIELAENLRKVLPAKNCKIFYSDDGSTAVEAALKMAIQYWNNIGQKRKKILALEGAYHGDTFGAMAVSSPGPFRQPFDSFLFEVEYVARPAISNIEHTLKTLDKIAAEGDCAAFIFEPLLQGASGMNIYGAEELELIINFCKQHSIITIADEVFTGFGRTGKLFASENLKTTPDIFCLSKGLTGGTMPLGVTAAAEHIFEAFKSDKRERMFLHGHSYTANALACCAGLASLELLLKAECSRQRSGIENQHKEFARKLSLHEKASNVRVLGTVMAFEVLSADKSYLNPLRDTLYKHYLDSGVILRPLGNTVYIVPPYCINPDQLKRVYGAILTSLELI